MWGSGLRVLLIAPHAAAAARRSWVLPCEIGIFSLLVYMCKTVWQCSRCSVVRVLDVFVALICELYRAV